MKSNKLQFHILILIAVFVFAGLILFPNTTRAACTAEIAVVLRDPSGNTTPGLRFEIYKQESDANGDTIPSAYRSGSGAIGFNGKGTVRFYASNESGKYAIKVYEKNSRVGEFWFFDAFTADCGSIQEVELQLSSVGFVLRDINDKLIDSATVFAYEQVLNADGQPVAVRDHYVGQYTYRNGVELEAFLPDASHTLHGSGTYLFVIRVGYGNEFIKDNIVVNVSEKTEVEYMLGGIEFDVRDINGKSYPKDVYIDIYTQPDEDREVKGVRVASVKTDDEGKAIFTYKEGTYVAIVRTRDGEFTFYNQDITNEQKTTSRLETTVDLRNTQVCSSTTQIYVITRRTNGRVLPNMHVELFEQGSYSDGNRVVSEIVATGMTDGTGRTLVKARVSEFKTYTLRAYKDNKELGGVWIPNLKFECGERRDIEAEVPALNLTLVDASNVGIGNTSFNLYRQIQEGSVVTKDTRVIGTYKTDGNGKVTVLIPYGTYILEVKNAAGTTFTKTHINIPFNEDKNLTITLSDIVFKVVDTNGKPISVGVSIDLHKQIKVGERDFVLGAKIGSSKVDHNGNTIMQVPAGTYAVSVRDGQGRIYNFFNVSVLQDQRTVQKLVLDRTQAQDVVKKPSFSPLFTTTEVTDRTIGLVNRLDGHILLQVEAHGEAFYVDKATQARYYLQDGASAYSIMRKFGLGITNVDLEKIQVGYDSRFSVNKDSDADGLSDKLEEALGTNPVSQDTDHDFYSDREEVENGYSPLGDKRPVVDQNLVNRLRGRILLQVEGNGEAWYVNPKDGKRYYMADGDAAFEIMRFLGLGITNADLSHIPVKSL